MHTCELIYRAGAKGIKYGDEKGICRITGKLSEGLLFEKWVRKTFNDFDYLNPGTIISNEALFCFDESSNIVQEKTGRDKPQRFRTYSHIIKDGEWYCLTKADKRLIYKLITEGAECVCLTETGQKHIVFKHRTGLWQLDDSYIKPDIDLLVLLHNNMTSLLYFHFSQTEIITGNYLSHRMLKVGLDNWKKHEDIIKIYRNTAIFDFASFMLFTEEIIEIANELNNDKDINSNNDMACLTIKNIHNGETLWD